MTVKDRKLSLAMVVSTEKAEFSLSFEGDGSVRIFERGDFMVQLYEEQVQDVFTAIMEGFHIIRTGHLPQVLPCITQEEPSNVKFEEGPSQPPEKLDPIHFDDPNIVYLLRHEYKDNFFSASDMHNDRREYTGRRDEAYAFPTRYAALRFTQGMRHPTILIPEAAAHIVSWKTSDNDIEHFHDGSAIGTIHEEKAQKLTLKEAQAVYSRIPGQFILTVKKVVK
jgi:hypothetical protein